MFPVKYILPSLSQFPLPLAEITVPLAEAVIEANKSNPAFISAFASIEPEIDILNTGFLLYLPILKETVPPAFRAIDTPGKKGIANLKRVTSLYSCEYS